MEIINIVLVAVIFILIPVVYGLWKRLNQAKNQIKEMELDLNEYIIGTKNDARTITDLKRTIEKISKELQNIKTSKN